MREPTARPIAVQNVDIVIAKIGQHHGGFLGQRTVTLDGVNSNFGEDRRAHRAARRGDPWHLGILSYVSIRSVLEYLDQVEPGAAKVARERYGCLTPWQGDPAAYGHAALTGSYHTCEQHVVRALKDLLESRVAYAKRDGERFFDAVQNARLVANAESATIESCIMARVRPGTCATSTCS